MEPAQEPSPPLTLVMRPAVLMMDEPFVALDKTTRNKLNDDLVALKRELKATAAFATHSGFEGVYPSDRIVVMAPVRAGSRRNYPFPLKRAARTIGFSAFYSQTCRQTSRALRRAMDHDPLGQSAAAA
jgi:NitT/TauT family transport system ATP-binding protein